MKKLLLILFLLISVSSNAKVSALFHPYDNTFEAIISRLKSAQESVDLALYNMDTSAKNPIMAYFASPEFQDKLKRDQLQVRMVFEGYAAKEDNLKKMLEFEKLGIDVRTLRSSKKMHHKFAVIDGHRFDARVISGSANWSMSSFSNYNENILFFDQEEGVALSFKEEFDFLWSISKEVGDSFATRDFKRGYSGGGIGEIYFNRDNFVVKNGRLYKERGALGFILTNKIVAAIDEAEGLIEIATTRLKLRPIYNALRRALKRGVRVNLVVTMGEYDKQWQRKKMTLPQCEDEFEKSCSSGVNYVSLLQKNNYEGHQNIEIRLKFFNLLTSAYLNKQMHSKYVIVDNSKILSGSFNWSYSGEFNHIENLIELDGQESEEVAEDFNDDFDRLWELGRSHLSSLHHKITEANKSGEKISCAFSPMSLTHQEIDALLKRGHRHCR